MLAAPSRSAALKGCLPSLLPSDSGDVIHVAHCIPYLAVPAGVYAMPGAAQAGGWRGPAVPAAPATSTFGQRHLRAVYEMNMRWEPALRQSLPAASHSPRLVSCAAPKHPPPVPG